MQAKYFNIELSYIEIGEYYFDVCFPIISTSPKLRFDVDQRRCGCVIY